jgi:hypothetical protein
MLAGRAGARVVSQQANQYQCDHCHHIFSWSPLSNRRLNSRINNIVITCVFLGVAVVVGYLLFVWG